jgi:hypothetical protein
MTSKSSFSLKRQVSMPKQRGYSTAKDRINQILRTSESSLDKKMKDLSKQFGSIIQEVKESRDMAYETGKEVGQYSTINMLSKLLRGEPIDGNKAVASMQIITNCMENWAYSNNERELGANFMQISSILSRMMRRV